MHAVRRGVQDADMTYFVETSNGEDTEIERYDDEYEAATCFAERLQDVLVYTDNPFHRHGTVILLREGSRTILEYSLPLD